MLCLHPAGSSAYEHGTQFSALASRLRTKHGIELLFVDAPMLDATTTKGRGGGGDDDNDEDGNAVINNGEGIAHHRRRWYVKEEGRTAATTTTTTLQYYLGLDASLLHLSQLYNKIGGVAGVLGVGQGADVAALLPLLTNENYSGQNNDNIGWEEDDDVEEDVDVDDDDGDDDATTRYLGYNNDNHQGRTMFPGLEFVILVNGSDVLCLGGSNNNNVDVDADVKIGDNCNATSSDTFAAVDFVITKNENNSASEGDNLKKNIDNNRTDEDDASGSYYVGKDGVQSLHVIFDEDGEITSERLAQMYGPNATIHRIPPPSSSSSPRSVVTSSSSSALLSNIIGRYLVSQKTIIRQPTSSTNCSSGANIRQQITKLRKRLWDVEQLATIAIAEEIRCNPPKALMAVIGPAAILSPMTKEKVEDVVENVKDIMKVDNMKTNVNAKMVVNFDDAQSSSSAEKDSINTLVVDKVVGAWQGGRRREFGEEGGGAPCPQEFLLREDER